MFYLKLISLFHALSKNLLFVPWMQTHQFALLAAARPKKHPMPSPLLKFEESKQ